MEADRGGLVLVANVLVANVLANGAGEVEMLRQGYRVGGPSEYATLMVLRIDLWRGNYIGIPRR